MAKMGLEWFCEARGWQLDFYNRSRWRYLKITRKDHYSPFGKHSHWPEDLAHYVRQFYSAARVVKHDRYTITMNIGTVFDAIRDSSLSAQENTFAAMKTFDTLEEFASVIVHPMLKKFVTGINKNDGTVDKT